MGAKTEIAWTDSTWNPTRGCSRISPGCVNCYAERQAIRMSGPGKPYEGLVASTPSGPRWTGKVRGSDGSTLLHPLHWREPRRIFVDSMSDLFHEALSDEDIDKVFGVMLACQELENGPTHTFQVLTKRADRMEAYFSAAKPAELVLRWARANDGVVILDNEEVLFSEMIEGRCSNLWGPDSVARVVSKPMGYPENCFPLRRVWLGVSIESQAYIDRVQHLLRVPAVVRFLSIEPLLAPVDLSCVGAYRGEPLSALEEIVGHVARPRVSWVIVGGESGPGARPMQIEWARQIVRDCQGASVPVFVKQLGSRPTGEWGPSSFDPGRSLAQPMFAAGKYWLSDRKGSDPSEWPEDLRVQEFPEVTRA